MLSPSCRTPTSVKIRGASRTSKPDLTANVYMQLIEDSVKRTQEAIYSELTAPPKLVGGVKKAKNLVRFGTVGVLDGPHVIVPQGLGA